MAIPTRFGILKTVDCEGEFPDIGEQLDWRIFPSWELANNAILDSAELYCCRKKFGDDAFKRICENCVQYANLTIQWNVVAISIFEQTEG